MFAPSAISTRGPGNCKPWVSLLRVSRFGFDSRSRSARLQTLTVETLFLAALPLTDHQNERERRALYETLVSKDLCDSPGPVAGNRILGIAMELSKTISLFAHASRFVTLTFAAAMTLLPAFGAAFPNGEGVDRRCVLQRTATAREENIVVLYRGAAQQQPHVSRASYRDGRRLSSSPAFSGWPPPHTSADERGGRPAPRVAEESDW